MKTYLYKVKDSSTARGYNRTIEVFRIKNNIPTYLGYNNQINTASYKGDKPVAEQLIGELEGLKFKGYGLITKNVQVFEI